jgi:hypothetical protein
MSHVQHLPMDTGAVAALLGLKVATVTRYLTESRKIDGRYYTYPFPEPDDYISGAPYWLSSRSWEIEDWNRCRPGRGAGGGRKRT